MNSTTQMTISLTNLNALGYQALQHAQSHMLNDTLSDGGARWVPVPYASNQAVMSNNVGVGVEVTIDSTSPLADISWTAAKAYTYALYTGCIDILKRRALYTPSGRVLGVGSNATTTAYFGLVSIVVSVTVLTRDELHGREY